MTERKTSYLTGLSLANQYAASGAFKGNAAADFGAMLLLRSSMPFNGFSSSAAQRFLCGNLQATSLIATKGWGLRWLAGPQPGAQLELVYGDSALAQQSFVARPLVPTQMAQRTMLVHVFLLRDPVIVGANNVTMLLYVNGALVARTVSLSFTPADGTGVFRIGGATINGSAVDAPGVGVAGFAYCANIAGASLAAKLATVQAMVDATLAQTLDTGDIADDALVSNLFSVRKALPDPRTTWVASKGAVNLSRVGSSSLAVEAGEPLFNDVPWEDLTPVPNILDIMGQAGLVGWWNAGAVDGTPTSSAADLSGNGHPALQPNGAQQPAVVTGVNGQPAWNMIRANLSGLQAAGLALAIGTRPCSFVVAQTSSHLHAAHAMTIASTAPASGTQLADGLPPGLPDWLAIAACADGSTGLMSLQPVDNVAHLFAMILDPGGATFMVDAASLVSAKTGGLANLCDYIALGNVDPVAGVGDLNGWDGLIYEGWATVGVPTPSQIAAMHDYVRSKYLIPIA